MKAIPRVFVKFVLLLDQDDLNRDEQEARYLTDDMGEIDYEDFSFSE